MMDSNHPILRRNRIGWLCSGKITVGKSALLYLVGSDGRENWVVVIANSLYEAIIVGKTLGKLLVRGLCSYSRDI